VLEALAQADGAVPGVPLTDTIKRHHAGMVVETPDRSQLVAVQTPQAFRGAVLAAPYAQPAAVLAAATDCASLWRRPAAAWRWSEGDPANIKINHPRGPGGGSAAVLTDYHMHLAQDGLPYDDDDFSLAAHRPLTVERAQAAGIEEIGSPTTSTGSDAAAGSTTRCGRAPRSKTSTATTPPVQGAREAGMPVRLGSKSTTWPAASSRSRAGRPLAGTTCSLGALGGRAGD